MPGAFELPQAARCAGGDRAVRRGRLPRLRDSRGDAALRVHRGVGGARDPGGGGRHRRADGVRRADDRHAGSRRRSAPAAAATTRDSRRRRRRSRWRSSSPPACDEARRLRVMTRVDPTARRRAREAALQMLYQAEVGRAGPQETIVTFWRGARRSRRQDRVDDELRAFANALVEDTLARRRGDRPAACDARAATGGSSAWPSSIGWCCGWPCASC